MAGIGTWRVHFIQPVKHRKHPPPASQAFSGWPGYLVRRRDLQGDLLIVRPVRIGDYRRGDLVVATVNGGTVVKAYGGQGSAATG